MPGSKRERLTIGVLAGWQVYEGTNPNRLLETVFGGIQAEARERGSNVLLACGVGARVEPRGVHPAWPVPSPETDFVPVGPWNVDGLIVISPVQDEERTAYIQDLVRQGFPVVFVGSGEGTPAVGPDNVLGIRQALSHLVEHGHKKVAFVAGDPLDSGESMQRLMAFQSAMSEYQLGSDWRLMAYGLHTRSGGYQAMQNILKSGLPFTAVMTSNDLSALGALRALQEAGRRVPHEVAVIGFDDRPEAGAHVPPLTTVCFPLAEAGRRAVALLAARMGGQGAADEIIRIPTRLAIRQSCGCLPTSDLDGCAPNPAAAEAALGVAVAAAVAGRETPQASADVQALCRRLVSAFSASLAQNSAAEFRTALLELLQQIEAADGTAHAWQAAVSALRGQLPQLLRSASRPEAAALAEDLLHLARVALSESAQRQDSRHQFLKDEYADRLSVLTVQLLAAANDEQIFKLLFEDLPDVGMRNVQVALFEREADDPVAWSALRRPANGARGADGARPADLRFRSRDFPPPGLYPAGQPFSLALLPLRYQDEPLGFMAFEAANLRPCATLARQLAVALKSAWLNAEVRELSLTDSLTGLHNRRYLELFLPEEVERSRRSKQALSVIMLDLDRFKSYNDTYGHQAGDVALQTVALCLRAGARRGVDVVMRYGGEEFIVVLPETGADGAWTVAENIRKKVAACTDFKRNTTVSLGVATLRGEGCEAATLIHQADTALYQAKKSGRNRVCAYVIKDG